MITTVWLAYLAVYLLLTAVVVGLLKWILTKLALPEPYGRVLWLVIAVLAVLSIVQHMRVLW